MPFKHGPVFLQARKQKQGLLEGRLLDHALARDGDDCCGETASSTAFPCTSMTTVSVSYMTALFLDNRQHDHRVRDRREQNQHQQQAPEGGALFPTLLVYRRSLRNRSVVSQRFGFAGLQLIVGLSVGTSVVASVVAFLQPTHR